jgi:creatinine amidohydrolase/Fe(II)-dependent formamide hydrolase-like protein
MKTAALSALALALLLPLAQPVDAQRGPRDPAAQERAYQEEMATPNPLAARHSYWIDELTWMEVRDKIAEGYTTAIVPTGGIEQNGPYLTTGKHNVIMEGACPAIAEKLGNALCAPVVPFVPEGSIDPPSGAMRYPGSISLRPETYQAMLDDIASSLEVHGFTDVVLIGDSGGNQSGMEAVAATLNQRWAGSGSTAHFVREYYTPGWEATEDYTAEVLGVDETMSDGYHDDIWVTALMMITDPTTVRWDERVDAGLASINGVSIVPLQKTVELGLRMQDFRADLTARAIRASMRATSSV